MVGGGCWLLLAVVGGCWLLVVVVGSCCWLLAVVAGCCWLLAVIGTASICVCVEAGLEVTNGEQGMSVVSSSMLVSLQTRGCRCNGSSKLGRLWEPDCGLVVAVL